MTQSELLGYISGAMGFGATMWIFFGVLTNKMRPQNPATWFMWGIIHLVILITHYQEREPPWLPLGFTVGTAITTWLMVKRDSWRWGDKEKFAGVCAAIAVAIWLSMGAKEGLVSGAIALVIAGLPFLKEFWQKPDRATWPIWTMVVVASLISIASGRATALAYATLGFNALMAFLAFRAKKA